MNYSCPIRLLLAGVVALSLPGLSTAQSVSTQEGTMPAEPRLGQLGKDVMWLPSPDAAVDRMLQMAQVQRTDLVVDLGAGDGKIPIAAARSHGARALGLEYNPALVAVATRRAREAGVTDRVAFQQADIFAADFSSASVVTMYLLPELNLRLRPILFAMRPGTRIVSHSFDMGDWTPDEQALVGTARVSAWKVPANASGEWEIAVRGLDNTPHRLRLQQKFQVLQGTAVFGKLEAGLVRPHLSGDAVAFSVRPATGEILHFAGRIQGDRMTGSVTQGARTRIPFEASRRTPAAPIEGIVADEQEMQRAQRLLESGA